VITDNQRDPHKVFKELLNLEKHEPGCSKVAIAVLKKEDFYEILKGTENNF